MYAYTFLALELRRFIFASHDLPKVVHQVKEWKWQEDQLAKMSSMIFQLQYAGKDICIYTYKHGITLGASECPAELFPKDKITLVKNSVIFNESRYTTGT